MKDLRITGITAGILVDVRFRTDLIGSTDKNFTIMQIQVGGSFSTADINEASYVRFVNQFKQIPSNIQAFIAFCSARFYNLSMANTDGTSKVVLYEADESMSASI